jgi:hypothetical protein
MSKWILLFTAVSLFAMLVTRTFDSAQYRLLFAGRVKFAVIVTLATAVLVAILTEWIIQSGRALTFLDYTVFMLVSYLGAFIWWLILRFVRYK